MPKIDYKKPRHFHLEIYREGAEETEWRDQFCSIDAVQLLAEYIARVGDSENPRVESVVIWRAGVRKDNPDPDYYLNMVSARPFTFCGRQARRLEDAPIWRTRMIGSREEVISRMSTVSMYTDVSNFSVLSRAPVKKRKRYIYSHFETLLAKIWLHIIVRSMIVESMALSA